MDRRPNSVITAMRLGSAALTVLLMVVSSGLIFNLFQRQLSTATFAFGSHPEVLEELESSMEDQKLLSEVDPPGRAEYRARFDRLAQTTQRLQILEHARSDLARRYETILLAAFATSVLLATGVFAWRQSRHRPRLARLQEALTGLVEGRTDIEIGDRGRDPIGRIAGMVESTSRVMARDRQRLAAMNNLSAWQEAARRHAHEIRTPLTGARLELTRIQDLLREETLGREAEILAAAFSVDQEIDRLVEFTHQFHAFARLPKPQLKELNLCVLLEELVTTYGAAWDNLGLKLEASEAIQASVDRDLLRQVLVNLCENSSQALGSGSGTVVFRLSATPVEIRLDVSDDGPGVTEEIRSRLFEPYVTTRRIGEGVGIGLAISKKILLDHGGDLVLLNTPHRGTTFRLVLPHPSGEEPSE